MSSSAFACAVTCWLAMLLYGTYLQLTSKNRDRVRQVLLLVWCFGIKLPIAIVLSPLLWLLFKFAPAAFLPVFTFLWPHLDILGEDDSLYLRRFFMTPKSLPWKWDMTPKVRWFRPRFLHYINRSDEGRDPHDHPGSFTTKILHGGYCEKVYRPGDPLRAGRGVVVETKLCLPGAVLRNEVGHTHMVKLFDPTWTWVVGWKRGNPWGFWVLDPEDGNKDRWIHSEKYGLKGREVKSWELAQ